MENENCEAELNWTGKQLVPVQGFGWLPAFVQGEGGHRFKVGRKLWKDGESEINNRMVSQKN